LISNAQVIGWICQAFCLNCLTFSKGYWIKRTLFYNFIFGDVFLKFHLHFHRGSNLKILLSFFMFTFLCSPLLAQKNVLFIAGAPSHGYGKHEHQAGCRLLAKALNESGLNIKAQVVSGWPEDSSKLEHLDTIVAYTDGNSNHILKDHQESVQGLMDRGVGLVLIHYSVEMAQADGGNNLQKWVGGFFETHWSVNPHWQPEFKNLPIHDITRGVRPFKIQDEWYFNMRFVDAMKGVTPILSAVAPEETMARKDGDHSGNPSVRKMVADGLLQHVAWAYERADGGRGFGFTGGHYHDNWAHDDFRKLVLNAIAWTAKVDVPKEGVPSSTPTFKDLEKHQDEPKGEIKVTTNNQKKDDGPHASVALESFKLPDDLEISVYATSPQFYNPTNIDVDEHGNVWVAEGVQYRKFKNKGFRIEHPEGDRIVVLKDANGDGKADSSHVFVQDPELMAPLGIAVFGNKVVVSQPPFLIVYNDNNRNGIFDSGEQKTKLLSGFGGWDHDHSLHSVTAGPDGKWYFNTGNAGTHLVNDMRGFDIKVASTYKGGAPSVSEPGPHQGGKSGLMSSDGRMYVGGASFRMDPLGYKIDVVGHNYRNPYEQTITSFGDMYMNDNDDPPACRTTWLMENGNLGFKSFDGKFTWQSDVRPLETTQSAEWRQTIPGTIPAGDVYGSGSPTGITYYENGALGEKYGDLLLSCEALHNVIFGYYPEAKGAGFELKRFDFLKSSDAMFRPSDVCIAPDGAILVADWYDPGVGGHAMRDMNCSGTIYRITKKGATHKIPSINLEETEGQLEALRSPSINVRFSGFHALKAAGQESVMPVQKLLNADDHHIRARALFLLAQLGDKGMLDVKSRLSSSDAQIKVAAIRALRAAGMDVVDLAIIMIKDKSPAVQRELGIALRDVSYKSKSNFILDLIANHVYGDRWSVEAIGMACENHEADVFDDMLKRFGDNPTRWSKSLQQVLWRLHPDKALPAIGKIIFDSKTDPEIRADFITVVGINTSKPAYKLMDRISKGKWNDSSLLMANWYLDTNRTRTWEAFYEKGEIKDLPLSDSMIVENFPHITTVPEVGEIEKLTGDARNGKVFFDRCNMCHETAKNVGVDFGPKQLTTWAKGQSRAAVIEAIVNPSAGISLGFDGTELKLKNGVLLQGILVEDGKYLKLKVIGGQILVIPSEQVQARKVMTTSLMMSASQLGMSAQNVADLVEYLKK